MNEQQQKAELIAAVRETLNEAPCDAPAARLHVCGLNHERAGLEIREQFALDAEGCARALADLAGSGLTDEAMALSTCNRTEIYGFEPEGGWREDKLEEFFEKLSNRRLPPSQRPPLYHYSGREAIRHFFAVNSGLDSQILGENEIKAQVRGAFELSRQAGLAGPHLHRLIEWANRCAKRIRTETELNSGTLCYGRASVLRGEQVLGTLADRTCMVIGAGKIGRSAAVALAERNPQRLIIVNRTPEKAREVARGLDAEILAIEEMLPAIEQADLIIGAAFAPRFLVTREAFERVCGRELSHRTLCLIDAAVPRILDHAIGDVPGVVLLDIGDLEGIIGRNRETRSAAARDAWQIVEEEIEKYERQRNASSLGPIVERLKQRFECAFDETQPAIPTTLNESERQRLQAAQQQLKKRLLHEAIHELKSQLVHHD